MSVYAVWDVYKRETIILEEHVYAECQENKEKQKRKFNAKNVDVRDVQVVIEYIWIS